MVEESALEAERNGETYGKEVDTRTWEFAFFVILLDGVGRADLLNSKLHRMVICNAIMANLHANEMTLEALLFFEQLRLVYWIGISLNQLKR